MDDKEYKAVNKLLNMYNKIENDLLEIIASHFLFNEEFLNSDNWRIRKLQEMGLFNEQVIKYIAMYSNKTPALVKEAMQEIGIDAYNLDKLSRVFEDGALSVDPKILIENGTVQALINAQYNELSNELINLSQKIEKGTRKAYLNIVEQTTLKVQSGTVSYQEAIRESINELSNKGITTLSYITQDELGNTTGIREYNIEGAVRREVITNNRNLTNKMNETIINELKPEYVKFSEHLQCRPTHFDWQGTIVKASEWQSISDYGDVAGLGGINCKHYVEPYFGKGRGNDEKKLSQKECDRNYKISQHQRYIERGVRKWQRSANINKKRGDVEIYKKSKDKLEFWNNRYLKYCDKYNLRPDYTRIYTR